MFDSVDPDWAWSSWQPTEQQPWDESAAAHLMRRAAFGASDRSLKSLINRSLSEVIDELAGQSVSKKAESFEAESKDLASSILAGGDAKQLSIWWLHRMLNTPSPLVEKMTLFWHGHFATGADKVKDAHMMFEQNQLLRGQALGSFRDLVQGISKDPAMLVYLDSAVNRKVHANENYAREVMELFCLGEGNYTEADVQELARCFTGWEVRRGAFRFNSYQHDDGVKKIFGQSVKSGEDAIDLILTKPEASQFIASKLFRFFIADEPTPPASLLEPLAEQLRSGWQIGPVVKRMLGSQLMFSQIVRGRKVRSPVDFALQWLTALECSTNMKKLSESVAQLGQTVLYPPNVKGWDGGRAWVNSSTLVARANWLPRVIGEETSRFSGGKLTPFFASSGIRSGEEFVKWFERTQLAITLSESVKAKLCEAYDSAPGDRKVADALILAAGLPEVQLA